MKKLENQTIFQCSYCSRISKSAAGITTHEKSCKKNPHNQLICASCAHCKVEEYFSEEGKKCETCSERCFNGECGRDLPETCDSRIRFVDFICDIDGSKMYAPNKIRRKASMEDIKNRCDKPMTDATQHCDNYKYGEYIYDK